MLPSLTLRLCPSLHAVASEPFLLPVHLSPLYAAVCSVLAGHALLVGASVADVAVPAGEGVFAVGLVRICLRPLSLPTSSRVARRCPRSFRPSGDAETEALG
jgi:hypothetical protein